MTRCATLIPSPMMLGWPLMSLTSLTGPRLTPTRICSCGPLVTSWPATASRKLMPANRVSSGSPRKLTAAPSPVSRMMRSSVATPAIASVRTALKRSFSAICSATERCEYSTMSRKSTLQMKVRLVCSAIFVRRSLPAGPSSRVRPVFSWGSILPRQGAAGTGKFRGLQGVSAVNVSVTSKIVSHTVQRGVRLIPGVKNIVAIASGKGGVGKSTTAVNLALALAAEGASVGVLDADIYGPSQPMMLGITGRPESKDGKTLEPMIGHGIQAISIGFLIDIDTPMVWRGPMVTQALEQLLKDTRWKDVDYLIVDMPPGTGDIQLTLSQKVPVTGVVIVTTPQDIALIDARKGLKMFEKVGIPILGIVENMSTHICSQCGHEEHIFGQGGAERMCKEYGTELLGALPLDIAIREQADSGKPTVVADPEGRAAEIYRAIGRRLAVKIAESARDMTSKFPNIVVSKNT